MGGATTCAWPDAGLGVSPAAAAGLDAAVELEPAADGGGAVEGRASADGDEPDTAPTAVVAVPAAVAPLRQGCHAATATAATATSATAASARSRSRRRRRRDS